MGSAHWAKGTPPLGGGAPPDRWAEPNSLEYQIHPPTIDTLVTGMLLVGSEKIEESKDCEQMINSNLPGWSVDASSMPSSSR